MHPPKHGYTSNSTRHQAQEDPLQKADPWANYQKSAPTTAAPATIQAVQRALETRIDSRIKQARTPVTPTGPEADTRISKLENDLEQLQHQTLQIKQDSQKMHQDFNTFSKDVDTRFGSLQTDFRNELQKQLQDQMSQLTQLLTKKD